MRRRQRHLACIAALVAGALAGSVLPVANLRLDPSRSAQAVNEAPNGNINAPPFRAFDPNALDGPPEIISPRLPLGNSTLPEGCESPVSFMTRSPLVNTAARCLT